MPTSQEAQGIAKIARLIHPHNTLLHTWRLVGGVSAHVTGLEVQGPDGRTTKLIVRRHGDSDLNRNPHIARDEFNLLQIAHSHGLTVPKPYIVDESRECLPTPYLVIEYIEGETELALADVTGYVRQLAGQLAKIHSISASVELSFLPEYGTGFGRRPASLDNAMSEGIIRDAIEDALPLSRMNAPVLLHGDFWPGNILWRDGELVAVIDWEDASIGDPLADLGNSRLELLWAFDARTMNEFTTQYLSMTDIRSTNLAYWDLCAALRPCSKLLDWGLDEDTEARMRQRHAWFVAQALEQLRGSIG